MKFINSKLTLLFIILTLGIVNIRCSPLIDLIDLFMKNEIVMCKGMSIEVTNKNGKLNIEAIDKFKRIYSWDSKSVTLKLGSRWNQRWDGSLGIYCPSGVPGIHCAVEEGQQHFCSKQELMEWIYNYPFYTDTSLTFIYTNNGLGIGWVIRQKPNDPKLPNMMVLLVNVWQLYINGKKPDSLPGATDSLVNISFDKNVIPCMPSVGNFIPSQPTILNGRMYSGRAVDIMKEGNISSNDIENVISNPSWKKTEGLDTLYRVYQPSFYWAKVDTSGRVILVRRH